MQRVQSIRRAQELGFSLREIAGLLSLRTGPAPRWRLGRGSVPGHRRTPADRERSGQLGGRRRHQWQRHAGGASNGHRRGELPAAGGAQREDARALKPGLLQADVGIAMGSGTDIAIDAADIIILNARVSSVVIAWRISHWGYRKMLQNVSLAFLFNGIGIPLASTGLIYPVWAMVAMAASVTAIFINSLYGSGHRCCSTRWPACVRMSAANPCPHDPTIKGHSIGTDRKTHTYQ